MGLNDNQIDEIIDGVRSQFRYLDAQEKEILTRSKQSFGGWVRNTAYRVSVSIGYYVALPVRLIGDMINGLWDGLTGKGGNHTGGGEGCVTILFALSSFFSFLIYFLIF